MPSEPPAAWQNHGRIRFMILPVMILPTKQVRLRKQCCRQAVLAQLSFVWFVFFVVPSPPFEPRIVLDSETTVP